MNKFLSYFKIFRKVIRFVIYFFLIIMLIGATQRPELLESINWEWWVTFFSLEIWYRVTDKFEIED